ncbi:hypothetical protein GN958_ATG22949 [Phytophthora infestans]|uniref:CBM1 domain-containing protein n=1 Tax=Phytophthora infestans TaxID=4787 RepID=A0A8S9TJ19_PHYIN|nr:hypothetical protein GN958_ATG22949 [Phytophthora infestans]
MCMKKEANVYDQCAGQEIRGLWKAMCPKGALCRESDTFYSQCLPEAVSKAMDAVLTGASSVHSDSIVVPLHHFLLKVEYQTKSFQKIWTENHSIGTVFDNFKSMFNSCSWI